MRIAVRKGLRELQESQKQMKLHTKTPTRHNIHGVYNLLLSSLPSLGQPEPFGLP